MDQANIIIQILESYLQFTELMELSIDSIKKAESNAARTVMAETARIAINNVREMWQPILDDVRKHVEEPLQQKDLS